MVSYFKTRRKRTQIRRLYDLCTNLSAIRAPKSQNFVNNTVEQPHLPIRHTKFSKCKWLQLPPKSVTFLLIFVSYHQSSRLLKFYKLNFNCNFLACSDSIMAVQRRNTDRQTDKQTDRQTLWNKPRHTDMNSLIKLRTDWLPKKFKNISSWLHITPRGEPS